MSDKVFNALIIVALYAATGGFAAGASGFLGVVGWKGAALMFGTLVATQFVLEALGPKPPGFGSGLGRDYRQQLQAAVTPVRWVYGRARVGGVMCFVNEYLRYDMTSGTVNRFNNERDPDSSVYTFDSTTGTYSQNIGYIRYHPDTGAPLSNEEIEAQFPVPSGVLAGGKYPGSAWPNGGLNFTAATEGIFAVFLLSQGEIDGIEKIFVDGVDMPFKITSNGFITPKVSQKEGVRFKFDSGNAAISFQLHNGRQYIGGQQYYTKLEQRWGRRGILQGISAIGVELTQDGDKPWSRIPSLEFIIRGVKIQWPGQLNPVWTENAAAIRWHYLTQAKGIPESFIDQESVKAAYNVCNQPIIKNGPTAGQVATAHSSLTELRYSINGVVSDDEDFDQVSAAMDQAWAGSATEINGKVVFRPGAPRPSKATLRSDDMVLGSEPQWAIETPLFHTADAVDAQLAHCADKEDFLPFSMPRIGSTEPNAVILDIGSMPYVAYARTAARLIAWQLRHVKQQRRITAQFLAGDNLQYYGLAATDRVTLDMPDDGISNQRFFIERVRYLDDGSIELSLVEEPTNIYQDTFVTVQQSIEDEHLKTNLEKPTGLRLGVKVNDADSSKRDIHATCDQSLDGTSLQLRYKVGGEIITIPLPRPILPIFLPFGAAS